MKHYILILMVVATGLVFADISAGDAAMVTGDYEAATDIFYEAYEESGDFDALYRLAEAMTASAEQSSGDIAVRRYETAADYAREAIALEPERSEGYMELARALGRLAQFKGIFESLGLAGEIRESLDKAIELDPRNTGAMHALAVWHLEVPWIAGGRSENTIPLFEQAISIKPSSVQHHTAFGEALLRLNKKERAQEMLEIAVALEASDFAEEQAQAEAQALLEANF